MRSFNATNGGDTYVHLYGTREELLDVLTDKTGKKDRADRSDELPDPLPENISDLTPKQQKSWFKRVFGRLPIVRGKTEKLRKR